MQRLDTRIQKLSPVEKRHNVEIQTLAREVETQTIPWTPGYIVKSGEPEVLLLDDFEWEKNLPAGRHEVDKIERMRKKRAWEKYLADIYSEKNAGYRSQVISDIELNEAEFREKEIDIINSVRMDLVHDTIDEFQRWMDNKFVVRLNRLKNKNAKLFNDFTKVLFCRKARAFRKLNQKQNGINMKYHKISIFEEFCDPTSDLYVNIVRFGHNPKYRHENLVPEAAEGTCQGIKKDTLSIVKTEKPKIKKHDCRQKLRVIEEDEFKHIYNKLGVVPVDKIQMKKSPPKSTANRSRAVPLIQVEPEREVLETIYQAALLLQKLIRGRAIQVLMYVGREKNRDLIEELKGTCGFTPSDEEEINKDRVLKLHDFREYYWLLKKIGMVAIVNDKLTGATINGLADFANKELKRIQDERRGYALVQIAEKARWKREAAESGRRQKELRRRRQHDEMYAKVMRKNEITTDFYLHLLMESAISTVSKEQAHATTVEYADKIDAQDQEDAKKEKSQIEREEMAAQIIHSFLLPEAEKQVVRQRIHAHQKKARDFARKIIYGIDTVNEGKQKKETELLEQLESSASSDDASVESFQYVSDQDRDTGGEKESAESIHSDISWESDHSVLERLPSFLQISSSYKNARQTVQDELSIGSLGSLIRRHSRIKDAIEIKKSVVYIEPSPDVEVVHTEEVKVVVNDIPLNDCSVLPPINIKVPQRGSRLPMLEKKLKPEKNPN